MSTQDDQATPKGRDRNGTPQNPNGQAPAQPDFRRQAAQVQAAFQQQGQTIDLASVPHNEYPADGMTMFCRTDASELSSNASPTRPISRDSQSEYSNPTSFSSVEPTSSKASPTKSAPVQTRQPENTPKKRNGFFSNSPFRRKSKHEKERPQSAAAGSFAPNARSNTAPAGIQARDFAAGGTQADDLEPVDPRASFQLNVGSNVFDVASPDASSPSKRPANTRPGAPPSALGEDDPIAAALAELKGVAKQSSTRVSADRYHGLATPAPPSAGPASRNTPPPGYSGPNQHGRAAASMPGTPTASRLDAPRPAHTAAQMQATSRKYAGQNAQMFGTGSAGGSPGSRPGTGAGANARSASPAPYRSTSPRPPGGGSAGRESGHFRATSPRPGSGGNAAPESRSRYRGQSQPRPAPSYDEYGGQRQDGSPGNPTARGAPMALQLRLGDSGALGQARPNGAGARPVSYYGGNEGAHDAGAGRRERSKSLAGPAQGAGRMMPDGTSILHHGKLPSHVEISFEANGALQPVPSTLIPQPFRRSSRSARAMCLPCCGSRTTAGGRPRSSRARVGAVVGTEEGAWCPVITCSHAERSGIVRTKEKPGCGSVLGKVLSILYSMRCFVHTCSLRRS